MISLSSRFREVLLDGRWIANTNYRELLIDVNYTEATRKIGSLNTIAALTFHINYYITGVINVFKGGELEIRDKYSFNLPPMTSENWEKLRNQLFANAEEFARYVERMPEAQLNSVFVDEKYGTSRRNIEGMIEHCYYHLGQISILKKWIRESEFGLCNKESAL